jgi:hypothetical protein
MEDRTMGKTAGDYASFREFYPFYLGEHRDRMDRRLHFAGTTLVIATLAYALTTAQFGYLLLLPLFGYGFAWAGHFFFEKNRPATFKYPFYSLIGDFVMYKDIWTGKLKL